MTAPTRSASRQTQAIDAPTSSREPGAPLGIGSARTTISTHEGGASRREETGCLKTIYVTIKGFFFWIWSWITCSKPVPSETLSETSGPPISNEAPPTTETEPSSENVNTEPVFITLPLTQITRELLTLSFDEATSSQRKKTFQAIGLETYKNMGFWTWSYFKSYEAIGKKAVEANIEKLVPYQAIFR